MTGRLLRCLARQRIPDPGFTTGTPTYVDTCWHQPPPPPGYGWPTTPAQRQAHQ